MNKKIILIICGLLISLGTIDASDDYERYNGYERYQDFNKLFQDRAESAYLKLASLNALKESYSQPHNESDGVFDYIASRDRHKVRVMFQEHKENLTFDSPEYVGPGKVLRKENETVGFIAYSNPKFIQASKGSLNFLVIATKHHQKGYARELLQYCFNDMENHHIDKIRLSVKTGNESAHHLYEKMGFLDVRRDDSWIEMVKTFKANTTN